MSKLTPLGPQGLHPAGALARTLRNHQIQNTIPTGAATTQVSSKTSGECPHSSRGSGATVGYHKKGYPKQEPKILLKPCKNQSQRTTTRSRQILRFARVLAPRPQAKGQKLPAPLRPSRQGILAETLSPRPSHRGPTPKGLGRDANSMIRSRLGSAATSSAPS